MADLSKLQKTIGYSFSNIYLLKTALTHKSSGKYNYEKLEFLGDSILNFCVSNILFRNFSSLSEGHMSILRAKVVSKHNLSKLGITLELDNYIRSDQHQAVSDAIRADVVESIIGAIFLDSNIDSCMKIINYYFEPLLAMMDKTNIKDPKSQLQEAAHTYNYKPPEYSIEATEGKPHEKTYSILCKLAKYTGRGSAASKRQAEMLAAAAVLKMMKEEIL